MRGYFSNSWSSMKWSWNNHFLTSNHLLTLNHLLEYSDLAYCWYSKMLHGSLFSHYGIGMIVQISIVYIVIPKPFKILLRDDHIFLKKIIKKKIKFFNLKIKKKKKIFNIKWDHWSQVIPKRWSTCGSFGTPGED